MDWDNEPLIDAMAGEDRAGEDRAEMPGPVPGRRRYPGFGLYDLNRLVLILLEAAALTGIILGDIWLAARV